MSLAPARVYMRAREGRRRLRAAPIMQLGLPVVSNSESAAEHCLRRALARRPYNVTCEPEVLVAHASLQVERGISVIDNESLEDPLRPVRKAPLQLALGPQLGRVQTEQAHFEVSAEDGSLLFPVPKDLLGIASVPM